MSVTQNKRKYLLKVLPLKQLNGYHPTDTGQSKRPVPQHFSVLYPVLFGLNGDILERLLGPRDAVCSHRVLTARAEHVAPARDQACGACGHTAGWQRNCLDSSAELSWFGELDEHNVVVQCSGAVIRVADDLSCINQLLC